MLFRTKYVSGVYHTLGINIIISERLKFLMKRCASVLSASSNIGISEEGEGEQPQIPRKQLSLWKKYRAPFLNHNKAKWMFWYQQERQHQIVLNSACDSLCPVCSSCMFICELLHDSCSHWTWTTRSTEVSYMNLPFPLKQKIEWSLTKKDVEILNIWMRSGIPWGHTGQQSESCMPQSTMLAYSLCRAMIVYDSYIS